MREGILDFPLLLGRKPLFERCSQINFDISSRTVRFTSGKNEVIAPYINDPSREDWAQLYMVAENFAASDLLKHVKETIGADIFCDGSLESTSNANRVAGILINQESAFLSKEKPIGKFRAFEATIDTTPNKVVNVPQFRVPYKYEQPLTDEINKLLRIGVLVPNDNNEGWNTPLSCVPKPNGKIRLVLSFNLTLNKCLVKEDTFSIPWMEEMSTIPPGHTFLGSLDVCNGYWNIKVAKKDQKKLSIFWQKWSSLLQRHRLGPEKHEKS
jgi:hypothetical protein